MPYYYEYESWWRRYHAFHPFRFPWMIYTRWYESIITISDQFRQLLWDDTFPEYLPCHKPALLRPPSFSLCHSNRIRIRLSVVGNAFWLSDTASSYFYHSFSVTAVQQSALQQSQSVARTSRIFHQFLVVGVNEWSRCIAVRPRFIRCDIIHTTYRTAGLTVCVWQRCWKLHVRVPAFVVGWVSRWRERTQTILYYSFRHCK